MSGVHTGPLMGMPQTNKPFSGVFAPSRSVVRAVHCAAPMRKQKSTCLRARSDVNLAPPEARSGVFHNRVLLEDPTPEDSGDMAAPAA
jgi:hypothetical protein